MPFCPPRRFLFLVSVCLGALVGACDRPFVEPRAPALVIHEPADSLIFLRDSVQVSIEASSFRQVDRVTVDGDTLHYDEADRRWYGTVPLDAMVNHLVVAVSDARGTTRRDTLHLAHLDYSLVRFPFMLPERRGGHTATPLPDGSVLVAGGAPTAGQTAAPDVFLLPPNQQEALQLRTPLQVARTGHTAVLLPDGRVLFLGGSRTSRVETVRDLVQTVEVYDPAEQTAHPLPFRGDPIQRTLHTATSYHDEDGEVVIDLFGGLGNVRSLADPRLGLRRDLRRFVLRSDTLVALDPLGGSAPEERGVRAVAGHTLSPLQPAPSPGRHLVAGTHFGPDTTTDASFILDYTDGPDDLFAFPYPALQVPRTRHAAASFGSGRVLLFGGRRGPADQVLQSLELYDEKARRFFVLPPEQMQNSRRFLRRYAHTATPLGGRRVLLLGGFLASGRGVPHGSILQIHQPE